MDERHTHSSAALFSLSLSPGWFSEDCLLTGLGERERETWVVKVGHMLREKENEGGRRRERDWGRVTVTWKHGWVSEVESQRRGEREKGRSNSLVQTSGSVTGLLPFI